MKKYSPGDKFKNPCKAISIKLRIKQYQTFKFLCYIYVQCFQVQLGGATLSRTRAFRGAVIAGSNSWAQDYKDLLRDEGLQQEQRADFNHDVINKGVWIQGMNIC